MPDRRLHRGPHPEDHELFAAAMIPRLRQATGDLSWLLTRGYAIPSSLKLVGDRYQLVARQRLAVARSACGDRQRQRRLRHQQFAEALPDECLAIDGFNVITSVEAALSQGVLLQGRDGCYRDMASMHGSYKKVEETVPAIELVGQWLAERRVRQCTWWLDQPVSNSGRLKTILRQLAQQHGWDWQVELVPDPDPLLGKEAAIVASSDSQILDQASRWVNLARGVIEAGVADAWRIDLGDAPVDGSALP